MFNPYKVTASLMLRSEVNRTLNTNGDAKRVISQMDSRTITSVRNYDVCS